MEMKITYEVKGAPRRELAQAISEVLNTIAVYKSVQLVHMKLED